MNEAALYEKLNDMFRDFFSDDSISLQADTTANDIQGWDSLNHLNLLIAIESEFGFRFQTSEIERLTNVGDLVAAIQKKVEV